MSEGVSAKVEFEESGNIAVKQFKPNTLGNNPKLDYENEVVALQLLNYYRDQLSFQIPKLTEHGVYDDREDEESPVAYIKMNKLEGALSEVHIDHAKRIAVAMANLHALKISPEHQQLLKRDPVEMRVDGIQKHDFYDDIRVPADRIIQELRSMEGPLVFLHNDFGQQNTFAKFMGAEIEGVCDFCFSGMGVKELDFGYFIGNDILEKPFLDAYQEAGGEEPNQRNLDILKAAAMVHRRLWALGFGKQSEDLLDDTLKKLDGEGVDQKDATPLRHQIQFDFPQA